MRVPSGPTIADACGEIQASPASRHRVDGDAHVEDVAASSEPTVAASVEPAVPSKPEGI